MIFMYCRKPNNLKEESTFGIAQIITSSMVSPFAWGPTEEPSLSCSFCLA